MQEVSYFSPLTLFILDLQGFSQKVGIILPNEHVRQPPQLATALANPKILCKHRFSEAVPAEEEEGPQAHRHTHSKQTTGATFKRTPCTLLMGFFEI